MLFRIKLNLRSSKMNRFENITKPLMWSTTLLLAAIVAGCGGSGDGVPGAGPGPGSGPGPVGSTCTGTGCVNLGAAGNYVILAEAGVAYTPTATVTSTPKIIGNIGVSPAAASTITGFALNLPAGSAYATSTLVTGAIYAPGYAPPTPSNLTTAVNDKLTAYNAAAAMATAGGGLAGNSPGTACPGTGALGGVILTPGVYTCSTALSIGTGTAVTLSGAGVYVIKTTQTLTQAANTQVTLINGALPQNVFWQVAGTVSIDAGAHMEGVILSASNIALVTGATVKGRLYSATSVAMDANTVTQP
jgi:hypothetical protein